MDSLIGPRQTGGSKQEVLIKREEMFNLPAPQTTTICLLLSLIYFLGCVSFSVSFCCCMSHCLCLSFSIFLPLSPDSPLPIVFISLFLSLKQSPFLSPNSVSDLTHSHISLFFYFLSLSVGQYCPFLFLSPLFSLQQLSENCLLCEMRLRRLASSIRVRERLCKEVVKMTPPWGNTTAVLRSPRLLVF